MYRVIWFSLYLFVLYQQPGTAQELACSFVAVTNDQPGADIVRAADFDGDGDLDLSVFNRDTIEIEMLQNNGAGEFSLLSTFETGNDDFDAPRHVVGDMPGDNDPDIVIGSGVAQTVRIFLNNGDATFAAQLEYGVATERSRPAIGDIDGDQDLDVVVTGQGIVEIFLNNGDGTLTFAEAIDERLLPSRVAILDLDNDQDLDFVLNVIDTSANNIRVIAAYLNNGDGTFAPAIDTPVGSYSSRTVNVGDLNGDQIPDVVVVDLFDGMIYVLGNGDGTFGAPVVLFPEDGIRPEVGIVDVDGDQDFDLIPQNGFDDRILVMLNDGNGIFHTDLDACLGDNPTSIACGDFNGDGSQNVAIASSIGGTVDTLFFNCQETLFGDIDMSGAINLLDVAPIIDLLSNDEFQIEADINRDNKVDLLDVLPFVDLLSGM